jgi:hypothetical protein
MSRSIRVALSASVLVPLAAGCLDFTPDVVPVSEAGTDVVFAPEAAAGDGGACGACVQGAACTSAFQTCADTPKCGVMFECGLTHGCYAPSADLIACLAVCGQQAQLSGVDDPAVAPFTALYMCAVGSCASSCGR